MTSGQGSDPHLLALLRAIRLRQSAPDAAAAGVADTAAALTDMSTERVEPEPDPAESATGYPVTTPSARGAAAGQESAVGDEGRRGAGAGGIGRAAQRGGTGPAGETAGQPGSAATGAGAGGGPRPGSELLWRGGQGAVLGRSGLGGRAPDWAGASAAYGVPVNRVNPIGGINPAGPTPPVPNVPGVPKVRPIGAPGTEFPSANTDQAGTPLAYRTARQNVSADGMEPGDTTALLDTQRLLSTSLALAGGSDEVAGRLWYALLQAQPDLLAGLPGATDSQREQLGRALTWLVQRIDDPPAVVAGCARLGAALAECGVQWTQLRLVGAALAEALRAGMEPGEWRQEFDQTWRWAWQHIYKWLVHGGTLVAYQPTVWDTEVISHELRRPDLAVVRLRPFLPLPYRPGQYVRVEVDGVPGAQRPYSVAGSPLLNDEIELHVRAKTENGVSGTLVYETRVGDRIRVGRAEGDMGLPAEPRRGILMIAGDTGVAPMKAMLAHLAASQDPRQAVLFWGVRNLGELYDIDELMELSRQAPRITIVPVVAEGDPGPYPFGLVTDAVAAYGEWSRYEVYLAGPPLMLAATGVALRELGVDPGRIHHDAPE
ncbi:FAD-binding oxidoreductase [Actinoplanes regularis]|uniref:NAD(P)H-flavin reductase n=1 Tax=Actinoplanes regularis TaxID=52697 RepID=A0A238WB40_9ACTN|nr:FAD-binding oxidoreductase [Actinoplanes regularis]SNR43494.1 NAD(P)H-flavin reductase [Actinoplanes regularis]